MNGRDRDHYDRTVDRDRDGYRENIDRDRHLESRYRGFEHSERPGERKNLEHFDMPADRSRGGNMDRGPYENRYRGFEHFERFGDRYRNTTDRYRHNDFERYDRPGYSKREREQDPRDYNRSERPRHSHHQREKSKLGMSGVRVSLITNHYRLLQTKTWQLYQYRVDFSPEIEIISLKKRLILEQKELFGKYLFVGSMLFLTIKLRKDIMNFMSKDREDNPIQTTVKFVGLLPKGQSMNILNSIIRQSMATLQMQLVGRSYYDAVEQNQKTL